jgi:hypothetical protein
MAGDGDLVVREYLLSKLADSPAGETWDVRGIAGAGKSVLLREMGRRAGRRDLVITLEMQDYYTAFERGEAAIGRAREPGGELRRFGRALSAVAGPLLERPAREAVLNDIGRAVCAASELSEAEADSRAEGLIGPLGQLFNERIAARTAADGRVLLLADTYEMVIDRPLGRWFSRLIEGLVGAVVVVARRTRDSKTQVPPVVPRATVLEVRGLTADEVRDYLVRRLGAPGGAAAAAVHAFTGGHALAVGLTADLAADMRRRGDTGTVGALLADLSVQPPRKGVPGTPLGKLIGRLVHSAKEQEPAIGKGLDCLWVVRRFDFPLLKSMLAVDEATSGAYRLAEHLVGYSFVEQRIPTGKPMERYYAVHDHVRDICLGMLEAADPKRLQALHGAAEEYYTERTDKYLQTYEGWFRYEDPTWQALVREWLYHVSQLNREGKANGRRGLVKLFLDAFLWWGHYIPFAFSEELLADWAEMAAVGGDQDNANRDWGNWLREVYLRYPKGRRAEPDRVDDWQAIKKRLSYFLNHPEIAQPPKGNKYMPRAQAMLHLFLGTAERSLNPRDPAAAAEHFQAARALLAADEAQWIIGWVWYMEADATLMRGDAAAADAAVAAADAGWRSLMKVADASDPDDYELAANLHRIHADAAWLRGEGGLSLDLYARAALSAYKFQVAVGDPDIAPIDEYTQAFMTEIHERAAARLAELYEAGDDAAAREACARIRRFFDPYWRAVRQPGLADPAEATAMPAGRPGWAAEVIAGLFPPPPAPADLHRLNTSYALTAGAVSYAMDDEFVQPPGTPIAAGVE